MPAATLEEAVAKGERKLRAKAAIISQKWEAMKPAMIQGYESVGWIGPLTKQAYREAIQAARHKVDVDKWAKRYREGISK